MWSLIQLYYTCSFFLAVKILAGYSVIYCSHLSWCSCRMITFKFDFSFFFLVLVLKRSVYKCEHILTAVFVHQPDIIIHHHHLFIVLKWAGSMWSSLLSLSLYFWRLLCFIFQSAAHSSTDRRSSVTSTPTSVPIAPRLQPYWGWSRGDPAGPQKASTSLDLAPSSHDVITVPIN